MTEIGADCCKPDRQQKHMVLDESIGSLMGAKKAVKALLCRITDEHDPPEVACEVNSGIPCIEVVLNRTPDRIISLSNDIVQLVSAIEERLF